MIPDADVEAALVALQSLEAEAAQGWPDGYDPTAVRSEAGAAVVLLGTASLDRSSEVAGWLTRLGYGRPFQARVPRRKRG